MAPDQEHDHELQCGGVMPTPLGDGFVCRECGNAQPKRRDFYSTCAILEASDLEPQEAGAE